MSLFWCSIISALRKIQPLAWSKQKVNIFNIFITTEFLPFLKAILLFPVFNYVNFFLFLFIQEFFIQALHLFFTNFFCLFTLYFETENTKIYFRSFLYTHNFYSFLRVKFPIPPYKSCKSFTVPLNFSFSKFKICFLFFLIFYRFIRGALSTSGFQLL